MAKTVDDALFVALVESGPDECDGLREALGMGPCEWPKGGMPTERECRECCEEMVRALSEGFEACEPQDTQDRIAADAAKLTYSYWGCEHLPCEQCPVLVDGKRPYERYGAVSCGTAKTLDLLRRQRELCEREAGR